MALYRRGKKYWMCFSVNGRQIRRSTGTDNKRLAEAVYAKVQVSIIERRWFDVVETNNHTFDEMMERFMKEYAVKKELKTQQRYRVSASHLSRFFSGMRLLDITPDSVSNYILARRNAGASASSINNERNCLSKAFNLSWKVWRWTKENPCAYIQKERKVLRFERCLDVEEKERLLAACKSYPELHLIV